MKIRSILEKFGELLVGGLILGVSIWIYLYVAGDRAELAKKRESSAPVIQVAALQSMELNNEVEALGTAIAKESVDISANAQEKVIRVNFDDGMTVREGALLVELENQQELAELNQAEINLKEEERELLRVKRLYDANVTSQKDFDERMTSHARAKTLKAVVQAQLDDRRIIAPFEGILGNRLVSVGDLVSPGTLITTLDDITELKVDFTIPEKYFARLHKGQEFEVANEAYPGRKFTGKVSTIAVRLNNTTRSVEVRGIIKNTQEKGSWVLRPGMLLVVTLNMGTYHAVMVPEKSIMSLGEIQYLFLYDAKANRVRRQEVKLGQRTNGMVEIIEGAKEGQVYVLEGVSKLNDGVEVRLYQEPGVKGKTEKNQGDAK